MARAPKTLTPAEKKLALSGIKTAIKQHTENRKSISGALKEAENALATAKKSADAVTKQTEKEAAAKRKEAAAAVAAVAKQHDAAVAKHAKLNAAAEKGLEKLTAQLAMLDATPVAAAAKASVGGAQTA